MRWFCVLTAITLVGWSSVSGQTPEQLRAFEKLYETELKAAGIVGSGFVFLNDNKVVAQYTYGLANISKGQKVDADTIWHWASNTKPFTGIAIMQLRDRGLLKLDDPVTKYLPSFARCTTALARWTRSRSAT